MKYCGQPQKQQVQRVSKRDGSDEALIKGIMQAQASRAMRLESATYVLDNGSTLKFLYEQIDKLHNDLVQSSAVSRP